MIKYKPYNHSILSINATSLNNQLTNNIRLVPFIGFGLAGALLIIITVIYFSGYLADDEEEDFKELPNFQPKNSRTKNLNKTKGQYIYQNNTFKESISSLPNDIKIRIEEASSTENCRRFHRQ